MENPTHEPIQGDRLDPGNRGGWLIAPSLVQAETNPLLQDALDQASAEGKPILVDFYTDW